MKAEFSWSGLLWRVSAGVLLVLTTFNPGGWSYWHWALRQPEAISALKVVCGLLLASAWLLYGRAAFQSLGRLGLVLTAAVLAAFVWLLSDAGLINLDRPYVLNWVILVALGLMLGFGLSWSILRRRLTGQVDVDEVPHH